MKEVSLNPNLHSSEMQEVKRNHGKILVVHKVKR